MVIRLVTSFVLLISIVGCAGDGATAPPASQPEEPLVQVGPPTSAPENEADEGAAEADADALASPDRPRGDGRPSWWLDEPHTVSGRVYVAVEALGEDVRAARRSAVDAGVEALRRLLGRDPSDDRVHATTVRPLPHPGGARQGMRYIGYVLVSAEAPERMTGVPE